jgi:hypothetical protein
VILNQNFELPAIKLNKDKVEVIPTISLASPPDLVMQLSVITDRFEHALTIRVVWLLVLLLTLK